MIMIIPNPHYYGCFLSKVYNNDVNDYLLIIYIVDIVTIVIIIIIISIYFQHNLPRKLHNSYTNDYSGDDGDGDDGDNGDNFSCNFNF